MISARVENGYSARRFSQLMPKALTAFAGQALALVLSKRSNNADNRFSRALWGFQAFLFSVLQYLERQPAERRPALLRHCALITKTPGSQKLSGVNQMVPRLEHIEEGTKAAVEGSGKNIGVGQKIKQEADCAIKEISPVLGNHSV